MENKDSLVSIVIPTYNVENYIEKCIRSLLGQTYGNIEVIVVSDGSTDSSVRICRELQKTDGRIRIIEKENGGVSSARNTGIRCAAGDFLMLVDSDDWVEPNYVSYLLKLVEKNKCEIGMNKNNYSDDNMNSSDREYVVSDEKAIEWIYLGNIFVAVWNKIYSMPFLKKIIFFLTKKFGMEKGCCLTLIVFNLLIVSL